MNKTNKIAIALIIVALSVSNLRAQQPSKGPVIQKEGLIDTLKQHVKTLDELISAINSQGVAFQLSENDLKVNSEFRQAGRYLGKSALDELVDFIRANYRPITINESLQLRRQVAAKIDYLSFAVTYKGETEQAYQFSIRYPGVDNRDFSTGKGCRELLTWNDKWGSRALNFIVTETTAEGVTVSLTDKISPLIESIDEKPEALGSRPQKISFRFDPCFAPHFQFVKGNSDRSLEAYYISEPITVGVLRLFDRKTGARTKIPTNAKDSDPISEIFFDDAEGIAKLIHSDLPSVSQMVNAIKTNVVDLEAGASLAKSSAGRLLEILR